MSSTDIKLPTSGSLNWGGGLNRYLENLNLEVTNLQRLLAQKKESYHLVGYAGSGMVGECDIEYDTNSHKVSFSGNVYLSGEHAYYRENLEVVSEPLDITPYPVFVFLKATVDPSGDNQGEYIWSIISSNLFQIDYHSILLGVFYRSDNVESFIPYYFSSAKTLTQHRYELVNRWADLNKNLTSLTVKIKNKIPSTSPTDLDWTGDFDLYCGGLGHNNEVTTIFYPPGKYTVSRKHEVDDENKNKDIDIILFKDISEGEGGRLISEKSDWSIGDFTDDKSVYFRILLDIFGNIIIQKSIDNTSFSKQIHWAEQQLYNARFASLESSIVSGDDSYSWEAGLPIEVARFGYDCDVIDDLTYKQGINTPGLAGFNFVKALNTGVAYQQAQNISITQNSEIWLDKVSFKNSRDPHGFTIGYGADSPDDLRQITFDFASTNMASPKVLWCQTHVSESIDLASESGVSISGVNLTVEATGDFALEAVECLEINAREIQLNGTCIDISSDNNVTIVANTGLLLKTSANNEESSVFSIQTPNETFLTIDTSKLTLSNDLHVENELSFGKEGFITLPSDRRLKTDIENITHSFLDLVDQTQIFSFRYKGGKDIFIGLMAQDLQNNSPSEFKNVFVKTHETEEYKDQLCIAETKLVYVLWKALQEEKHLREKLEKEISVIKKSLKI